MVGDDGTLMLSNGAIITSAYCAAQKTIAIFTIESDHC